MLDKLLAWDARISTQMRIAESPGLLRRFAIFFAHSGDSWFWILALTLLWIFGTSFWKERALLLAAGILVTAVLVLVIKFTIRRRRPEGEWGNFYRSTDPHSFPSGHAARACMLAVMGLGIGPAWLGLILLIWAPLVALARIAMGVHYVLDVIAGCAFGLLMGSMILLVVL